MAGAALPGAILVAGDALLGRTAAAEALILCAVTGAQVEAGRADTAELRAIHEAAWPAGAGAMLAKAPVLLASVVRHEQVEACVAAAAYLGPVAVTARSLRSGA